MAIMSEELTHVAVDAARAAGKMLRRHFRDRSLEVHAKAEHDFVTSAEGLLAAILNFFDHYCGKHAHCFSAACASKIQTEAERHIER